MSGAIVIAIVLGVIVLLRGKFGDAAYEKVVGAGLKWWFILTGGAFVCLVIYGRIIGWD